MPVSTTPPRRSPSGSRRRWRQRESRRRCARYQRRGAWAAMALLFFAAPCVWGTGKRGGEGKGGGVAPPRRNRAVLAGRPVWLFSSGPLGTEPTGAEGQDLTAAAEPKEIAGFKEAIAPRGHQVFFGVLDPGRLGLGERALRKLPAGRALLPEGDFRDWAQIEAWASGIARDPALGAGPTGPAGAAEEQGEARHGRAPGAAT